MLIHINSWPGAGKKTIGELLAARLRARFVHNHHLLDLVEACCDRGDPQWRVLYDRVREAVYESLAGQSAEEPLIMTNAIAEGEVALWGQICDLAARRGAILAPVILTLDPAENRKRLQDPDRRGAKLKSPEILDSLRAKHELLVPREITTTLVLDVSNLSPESAADQIEAHLRRIPRERSLESRS